MNNDGSFGDEVSLVSPEANPRCIGYYYDIDTPGAFDFGSKSMAKNKRALSAKAETATDARMASLSSLAGASAAVAGLVVFAALFVRRQMTAQVESVESA